MIDVDESRSLIFCPDLYIWEKHNEMSPLLLPIGLIVTTSVPILDNIHFEINEPAKLFTEKPGGKIEGLFRGVANSPGLQHMYGGDWVPVAKAKEITQGTSGLLCEPGVSELMSPILRLLLRDERFEVCTDMINWLTVNIRKNWQTYGVPEFSSREIPPANGSTESVVFAEGFPFGLWSGLRVPLPIFDQEWTSPIESDLDEV